MSACIIVQNRPIFQSYGTLDFRVSGVDCMNDDSSEALVLYGRVECEPLQLIADQIVAVFVKNGLMRYEKEHVKLHVTVINQRYRWKAMEKAAGITDSNQKSQPFDARKILEDFGDWDFGMQPIAAIHLSRLKTVDCGTGFYSASSVLKVF